MARYLLIWDLNPDYITENPVERGTQWKQLMEMVDQDFQSGVTVDWGSFVAERGGYCVVEGTELEVGIMSQRYAPYVEFETHAVATVDQTKELLNALSSQ